MKISFISTILNEEKNIEKFINSILNQTKKPDEIIIVDGGSEDKTYEILKKYSKKYKLVKVFQEKGVNIARGRNIAISKAKGETILTSDAGCVIDKNWVKDTLKYFPDYDFVAGTSKAIAKNNFEVFQSFLTVQKVNTIARISSRNSGFKKKWWKKVGGYPEKSLTGEDHRFHIELIDKGAKVAVNHRPLVGWEMRPTLAKFAKQFYLYGKGDRIQRNMMKREMKKNLVMVFGFWVYVFLTIYFLFTGFFIGIVLIAAPLIILELYSLKFIVKTKKISALFWIPVLWITKRVSYIIGVTFK